MDELVEKYLMLNKPTNCSVCNSPLFYIGAGKYECRKCNDVFLDDYGRVREFIEANGPTPAVIISKVTGVKVDIINGMLKEGKLEIPEGSNYYLKCEKCGSSLKYGRICPSCARDMTKDMQTIHHKYVGETPKSKRTPELQGKMHYLGKGKTR